MRPLAITGFRALPAWGQDLPLHLRVILRRLAGNVKHGFGAREKEFYVSGQDLCEISGVKGWILSPIRKVAE